MFNFTKEERQVILFLATLALVGLGANFLLKRYTPVKAVASLVQNLGKINLNRADEQTLTVISGIGQKLARRIVEYRAGQGDFKDIEELKKIKGITDFRYEKIKDLLFVE